MEGWQKLKKEEEEQSYQKTMLFRQCNAAGGCKAKDRTGGWVKEICCWKKGKKNNQTDRREKVITTVTEGKQTERRFKRKAGKEKYSTALTGGQPREGEEE